MKTLSIAKPLVIMIVGLPGAGKSYFAKQFADTFSVPLICGDDIRAELFAKPTFSSDENQIIGRIQDLMLEQLLKIKGSVIIDGNNNAKIERLKTQKLAKQNGFETLVVWVQTNPDLAKSRALKNADKPTKHLAITEEQFNQVQKNLAQPTTENYVVISGMHTYSTQAKTVLRKLATNHTNSVTENKTASITPKRPPVRNVVIR